MVDEVPAQAPIPEPTPPEPAAPVETPTPAQTEQAPTETPTAQIPESEPLPPEPEPIVPTPAPQPPQQAAVSASASPAHASRDLLVQARATIQDRKHKKLEKIMEALTAKGKITNDEVEKLLHVSDATATRYLSALEKEGKIQQVGKTGKAVEYTRI